MRTSSGGNPWVWTVLWALSAALLVAGVAQFAFHQDIWVDESTQLSGMTLAPLELFKWLAGAEQARFGVPGDRMPPVSYLLDWMWSGTISGSELSLRLFHGSIAVLGVFALAYAVARNMGAAAAAILIALFALSTRFVQTAVEIRAYPLVLGFTCALLAQQILIIGRNAGLGKGAIVAYALTGVLLVGTHFFGAVAYFSLALGLLWHFRSSIRASVTIILASGAVFLFSIALIPFVLASATLSDSHAAEVGVMTIVHFIARLLLASAESIWPAGAAAKLLGLLALLLVAALALPRSLSRTRSPVDDILASVVVALLVGLGVTVAAAFASRGFDPLKTSYSTWVLPPLLLLVVGGWRRGSGTGWWQSMGRHVALALVICGSGAAMATQAWRPELFIHGPHRFLLQQRAAAGNAPLIYDTQQEWGFGFFPLRYTGKGAIAQWRISDPDGKGVQPIVDGRAPPVIIPIECMAARNEKLILAEIRTDSYEEVRRYIRGADSGLEPGPVGRRLAGMPEWQLESVGDMPGYYSSRVWTWRRTSPPGAGSPASGDCAQVNARE